MTWADVAGLVLSLSPLLGLGLIAWKASQVLDATMPAFSRPEIPEGSPLWVARDLALRIEAGADHAAHEEQGVRVVVLRDGATYHVVANGVCMAEMDGPWAAATIVARVVEVARQTDEATQADRRGPRHRDCDGVVGLIDADRRSGADIDVAPTGAA